MQTYGADRLHILPGVGCTPPDASPLARVTNACQSLAMRVLVFLFLILAARPESRTALAQLLAEMAADEEDEECAESQESLHARAGWVAGSGSGAPATPSSAKGSSPPNGSSPAASTSVT